MRTPLIIVESPAKAKTISKFLGNGAVVESSIGHIRDLPSGADEIPDAYRKKRWARIGVNIEKDFEPLYVVPGEKKAQVKKLKDLLAHASELYLATDEDREGEAIAWHLEEVLRPKVPVRRMVFHEITEKAIKHAIAHPREIDDKLVEAQEARRILDRLYGYEVSPVLWRKIAPRLSAGRVQSVATRLIVERERARLAFRSGSYYGLTAVVRAPGASTSAPDPARTGPRDAGSVTPAGSEQAITAELVEVFGRRIATSKDFDAASGALGEGARNAGVLLVEKALADGLAAALPGAPTSVADVTKKPFTQRPYPPFITSSLQQEAARKLRFTAQRTMRTAQRLYEGGFITYMRTDSTTLSTEALAAARKQVEDLFGAEYLPAEPRIYTKQVKGAQEAHEAIRPAGEEFRTPESLKGTLEEDQFRLYDLIWKRTVASQMKDATGERTQVRVQAELPAIAHAPAGPRRAVFTASGKVLSFPGFLRAYVEGTDDPDAELEDQEKILPPLAAGDPLTTVAAEAREHTTQPPFRFTEASLVKELEDRGIGRPSTYASIIQTIQDRGYVFKKGGALVPTLTAFAVTNLLETHFGELVDYAFTAKMEDDLDAISNGEQEARPWLSQFYFGDLGPRPLEEPEVKPEGERGPPSQSGPLERVGLHAKIGDGVADIDPRGICALPIGETPEGEPVVARVGRYGPYVQVGDTARRANLPVEQPLDELTVEKALDLLTQSAGSNRSVGDDPKTGLPIFVKVGRFGPYIQLGVQELDAKGKRKKDSNPRMASLWPGMRPETLTLEQALLLLEYPKVLGKHPETGADVIAADGQYGPYITTEKDGKKDSRSLTDHEHLRTITLAGALELLAQPRVFGRRGAPSAGTVLGTSAVTGKPIAVKKGKFGIYVTDGQVNATVPSTKDPTTLTLEEALELIAAREEKMREQGKDPRPTVTATGSKVAKAAKPRKAAAAAASDDDGAGDDEAPAQRAARFVARTAGAGKGKAAKGAAAHGKNGVATKAKAAPRPAAKKSGKAKPGAAKHR